MSTHKLLHVLRQAIISYRKGSLTNSGQKNDVLPGEEAEADCALPACESLPDSHHIEAGFP